jgi:hypothetical protein
MWLSRYHTIIFSLFFIIRIIVSATNGPGGDGEEVACQCGMPAKRYNC